MTNAEKALQLHKEWNGKFETTPKMSITTREDLALAYTPGVAEPCTSSAVPFSSYRPSNRGTRDL